MSRELFRSVKATISKQWIESLPEDVLMQIQDLGVIVSTKGDCFVFAGTLKQIIAVHERLAGRVSFPKEVVPYDGHYVGDSFNCFPSSSELFESTLDELKENGVGTKVNHIKSSIKERKLNAALTASAIPHVLEPNDEFPGKARQSITEDMEIRNEASVRKIAKEKPPSLLKAPIRDLVIDSMIWEYIATVMRSELNIFKELGLSFCKRKHRDCTTITVKPVASKAKAYDFEMFDELFGNLAKLCDEVTKNCVVEACQVDLDKEVSQQLLKEMNSLFKDVLSMQYCDMGKFVFVGSKEKAWEARKHFMSTDPVRAASVHSSSAFQGIRNTSFGSDFQEEPAAGSGLFSRGISLGMSSSQLFVNGIHHQKPEDSGCRKPNDSRDRESVVVPRRWSLQTQQISNDISRSNAVSRELPLNSNHLAHQKNLASSFQGESLESEYNLIPQFWRGQFISDENHKGHVANLSAEFPAPRESPSGSATNSDQLSFGYLNPSGHLRAEPFLKRMTAAEQGFTKQLKTKSVNQHADVASRMNSLLESGDEEALVQLLDTLTAGDDAGQEVATGTVDLLRDQTKIQTGKAKRRERQPAMAEHRPVDDSDYSLMNVSNIFQKSHTMQQTEHDAGSPSVESSAQPQGGTFSHVVDGKMDLSGHERQGTIIGAIGFCSNVQQSMERFLEVKGHHAMDMTFYLPASNDGKKVLLLLEQAFDKRRLFRVIRSVSQIGTLVPNDIELKTDWNAYPDPTYLSRVTFQLEDLLSEEDGNDGKQ